MGCCQTTGPKGTECIVDDCPQTRTKALCCTCDENCEKVPPLQFSGHHHSEDTRQNSSSASTTSSSNDEDDAACIMVASEAGERRGGQHRSSGPTAQDDIVKVVVGLPDVGPQSSARFYDVSQTSGRNYGSLNHVDLNLNSRSSLGRASLQARPFLPGAARSTPETSPYSERRGLHNVNSNNSNSNSHNPLGSGGHGRQFPPFREAAGSFSSVSATGDFETPAASAVVPIGLPVHSAGTSLSQCPSMQSKMQPEMTAVASSESDRQSEGTNRTLSARSAQPTAGEAPNGATASTMMMARRSSASSSQSQSNSKSQGSQSNRSSMVDESRTSTKQTTDPATLPTTATATATGGGASSSTAAAVAMAMAAQAMSMQPSSSLRSQRSDSVPPAMGRRRSSSSQVGSSMSSLPSANLRASLSKSLSNLGPAAASASPGENWQEFLARAKVITAKVGNAAADHFELFRTSEDLGQIFASFVRLLELAGQESAGAFSPWELAGDAYPYDRFRVLLGGLWKAKKLWEKLDKRCGKAEFQESPCSQGRVGGRRVVVVGAGPCGLYTAIELRLLGCAVTVVERRTEFSRINQLHIWPWCGEEIKDLGARCLEPPPPDFGANPDLLSIGISDLQTMLLKTALLVGVEVFLGTDYKQVAFEQELGWHVQLSPAVSSGPSPPRPSPLAPSVLPDVAAVVTADGGCGVPQSVGVQTMELGSLRGEDAIGLVCNFAVFNTPSSRRLRSFALASQFYGPLFKRVAAATGAELENIVFTKSKGSYYFVMTPTKKCLAATGVLRDVAHRPLLAKENVNKAALEAFCRKVVSFQFKEGEPTLQQVGREAVAGGAPGAEVDGLVWADRGPQLFDFSKLRRASDGVVFLKPPAGSGAEALPFLLAGDTLLEPFWPEGLGIVRGFLSSLDACSALSLWSSGAEEAEVREHHALAFAQLKTLGARTRGSVMKTDESKYALDPSTRYRTLGNTGGSPTHSP